MGFLLRENTGFISGDFCRKSIESLVVLVVIFLNIFVFRRNPRKFEIIHKCSREIFKKPSGEFSLFPRLNSRKNL